ncbi:MAG: DUF5317 family protein [Atribacterota bacterium]
MNKNYSILEISLMIFCLGVLFSLIGVRLQFYVHVANEGLMPVQNGSILNNIEKDGISLEGYKVFNNKNEINKYYLSDIIPVFNQGYVSLGDIFIYFGNLFSIASLFVYLYLIQLNKKQRNKK